MLDLESAFPYGRTCRHVYIETLDQDARAKQGHKLGTQVKAMYGTRDASQMWSGAFRKDKQRL